jgi:hypothetical protein
MKKVYILNDFRIILSVLCGFIFFITCSNDVTTKNDDNDPSDKLVADVISVSVSGNPNDYQFSVGIQSPDTGCNQYADWWEVLSEEGSLIYRRILAHSHVNEQPFVRSGGPVPIAADDVVYVRAHMHPGGYGGAVFKGTVQDGFQEVMVSADFALEVEAQDPQPEGCAF